MAATQGAASPTISLIKSPQDTRNYQRLQLDNGLQVLLIQDPEMQLRGSSDEQVHLPACLPARKPDWHWLKQSAYAGRPPTGSRRYTRQQTVRKVTKRWTRTRAAKKTRREQRLGPASPRRCVVHRFAASGLQRPDEAVRGRRRQPWSWAWAALATLR